MNSLFLILAQPCSIAHGGMHQSLDLVAADKDTAGDGNSRDNEFGRDTTTMRIKETQFSHAWRGHEVAP